jgi:hypothetical protein
MSLPFTTLVSRLCSQYVTLQFSVPKLQNTHVHYIGITYNNNNNNKVLSLHCAQVFIYKMVNMIHI